MTKEGLPERLRSARKMSGKSQSQLAQVVAVNRATVAHWERSGGFVPNVEHLRALSEALDVNFEWLATGADRRQMEGLATAATALSRPDLEARLVQLSKHLPVSFLLSVVALMETTESYLL